MTDTLPHAEGGCLCGAVRYRITGPLRAVVNCHCGQCRRTHGHYAAYTSVAEADLQIEEAGSLKWYVAADGIARRGFCGRCGASLFWSPLAAPRVAVSAGSLDQPTGLHSVRHIFTADKGDYYEIEDGLEQCPKGMG